MNILGIDPGTTCGWAIRDERGFYASGTWDLKGRRFEGGGMRYLRMELVLRDIIRISRPDVVALEEVRRHKGTDAAHIYGGLIAVIAKVCEEEGIPYFAIPVGTVKRHATGRGNANKDAMVEAAQVKWPADGLVREDECDARWIADAAWHVELSP